MMLRVRGLVLVFAISSCLTTPMTGLARDFFVVSSGNEGDANPGNGFCSTSGMFATCTLRAAVEESNALPGGDRIFIGSGTIVRSSPELVITDSVLIQGNGAYETILLGDPAYPTRMFRIWGPYDVTIADLTLRGAGRAETYGDGVVGGAVWNDDGRLVLERVWFDDNGGIACGALRAQGASTNVYDSTFTNNAANGEDPGVGGAVCVLDGDTRFYNSTFANNSAHRGGALYIDPIGSSTSVLLQSSTLVGNRSTDFYSSAVSLRGGSMQIDKTLIVGHCFPYHSDAISSDGGSMESPGFSCLPAMSSNVSGLTRRSLHLGTPGDYGGPVPTVLPGAQSVAVDPGISFVVCSDFDARGEPRVGTCDVGATERQDDDPDSGPLFFDDFETGDTSWWSSSSP